MNLQALRQMCIGHLVADVVAIIGTLDIVFWARSIVSEWGEGRL